MQVRSPGVVARVMDFVACLQAKEAIVDKWKGPILLHLFFLMCHDSM